MVAILNLQNKNRNLEVLIWQYLKQKIYERYTEAEKTKSIYRYKAYYDKMRKVEVDE